ncbi:MAG TPA: hypothetical protein PK156_35225 [Polyangium sp.]|nr:hypothetical protein [Polyangium sp.]
MVELSTRRLRESISHEVVEQENAPNDIVVFTRAFHSARIMALLTKHRQGRAHSPFYHPP